MNLQPPNRSSNQPRTGGDWRRRLLRYHVPLALASAVVLALFMNVPAFDANQYPHADTLSGVFPRPRDDRGTTGHAAGQAGPTNQGGHQTGTTGHGGGQSGSLDQGGDHAGPMDEDGTRPSSSDAMPSASFLGLSIRGFTVGTGYLATGLLALTLLIGPANVLLRRRNPISSYLRRDVGMWTVIASVIHVIYGLQVHGQGGNFLNYFVLDGKPLTNSFGLANWTGLVATVIVVGLLAISTDVALRKLKARTWKRLQRLNYALLALVIAHAFFYGAVVRANSPYTLLLLFTVIAVFVGQLMGIWLWRRGHRQSPARPAG